MASEVARIAMWSGPRNISTTMMRAFENRPDAAVVDEPFYAAYLIASGADHPYRRETLAAQPLSLAAALRWLERPPSDFGKADASILFIKMIAYHLPADAALDFLDGWRNFLLIRDPARMVASYVAKQGDVAPILRSFAVARAIFDHCDARGLPCPIVDAADIQRDPAKVLSRLCTALDVPFLDAMLSWPAGARDSDGPWAPHWYDAVRRSTGFMPYVEKPADLTALEDQAVRNCRQDYEYLHIRRLT
ncbi:MAG: hypothetical protein K2Q06_04475 [Parvularculaceae bacterium]|nr:hypothetical protein [Parvularculaceae bacterium]